LDYFVQPITSFAEKISIPVKDNDYRSFEEHAANAFRYWAVPPTVLGGDGSITNRECPTSRNSLPKIALLILKGHFALQDTILVNASCLG
jgi:hypothetical protein